MRWALLATLGISLLAHGAVAAVLLLPRLRDGLPEADPPPQNAGETFELPSPEIDVPRLVNASPSPAIPQGPPPSPSVPEGAVEASKRVPAKPEPDPGTAREARASAGRAPRAPDSKTASDMQPPSSASPSLYGALGDRSAADISRAFTRDFPQAASGDEIWQSTPLGAAGDATLILTLDESGHIENWNVVGRPTTALTQGIRRTMTLLKARAFVAKARVTRLRLVATVTADNVHDGLHGEVFAIGGSFHEGEGTAFFALNVGRRIDLRVRAQ